MCVFDDVGVTTPLEYRDVFAHSCCDPGAGSTAGGDAVALSFDVNNATVPLSRGNLGSEDLSRGMYGAVHQRPAIALAPWCNRC